MKPSRSLATLLFSVCFAASTVPTAYISPAHAAIPAGMTTAQQGNNVLLNAVREAVRMNPALADGIGNEALLQGVRQAITQRPELSDAILASAKRIKPNLAYQIDMAAQNAPASGALAPQVQQYTSTPQVQQRTYIPQQQPVYTPQPTPIQPVQSAPAAATETSSGMLGSGLGNAALLGLAGVVAGTVAVVAATDGNDDDKEAVSAIRSEEFENQWGLAAIHADTAYARGATGQGVTVAVLDSGLEVSHPDIDNNVAPNGYNFVEGGPNVFDVDAEGHGTHVSGIIAAERDGGTGTNMHGVAYNANVLPIRIIGSFGGDGDPVGSSSAIIQATDYAVAQNVNVLNGSYGPDYSDRALTTQIISASDNSIAASYQAAADDGVVLVFSAGNDYESNPPIAANPTGGSIYPYVKPANANTGVYDDGGANYNFSGLEGMLLTVVATQENGTISTYSNRCGVAANWCIAAPGDNILSLSPEGGYTTKSGTSMAAPHVSGAVAVLIDMFPELTPEQIVQRLLQTATKTGVYANQAVYGQGFLNLAAATQPVGSLSVETGDSINTGQSIALNQSNLNLGPAFGDGLRAALVGQKLAVFDQQKATFVVNLADFTRTADTRFNLDEAMRRFRSRFGEKTIHLGKDASLSYTVVDLGKNGSVRNDPALGDKDAVMEMAYSQNISGVQWNMNYNINPSTMFGIYRSEGVDANAMLSRDAFSAPYLSFAKQGYSMGSQFNLSDSVSMSVGSFQGYPLADELLAPEDRAESFGHLVELAYKTGALKIFTQAGMLSEKNSFLGSRSEGAFDLESGTQTSFAGVNTAYRMTPHWSLVGSYYRGISNPQVDSNSLFNDISDVQTESFSVGMMGQDIVHEGDSLGILGNQPLRVTGGEASLSLASGRSRSGLLYKQDYEVNLAPTGRELNMEAFYHFNLPQTQTQLMSSLMYRTEPGHIEAAPDEGLFLLQLQQPF